MGFSINKPSWFLCTELRQDPALRLFCLPFAGAGASMYRSWSSAFPSSIEVRAVQLPGRESRIKEPRIGTAGLMSREIAKALNPYLQRPFALFGYSLGALLAFEVVRELRRRGAPLPVYLFVGAMRAPHLPKVHPPLSALPSDEFIDKINYYYQPSNTAWQQIPELCEILLPILRDDMSIAESYKYSAEPALNCSIHAYVGREDRVVTTDDVDAWREQTIGDFTTTVFSGGHFFLDSVLSELKEEVRRYLTLFLGDGE